MHSFFVRFRNFSASTSFYPVFVSTVLASNEGSFPKAVLRHYFPLIHCSVLLVT
jgi:hypothetical protein